MEEIHDRVAGLDVHRDSVAACIRVTGPARLCNGLNGQGNDVDGRPQTLLSLEWRSAAGKSHDYSRVRAGW